MLEDILKTIKSNESAQSIGTKQEKTLHKFIKYYLTDDISKHEITINNVYTFSRKIIIDQGQSIDGLVLECDINTLVGTLPNDIVILYNQFMKEASTKYLLHPLNELPLERKN